jgi:molecular chaperone GrpE
VSGIAPEKGAAMDEGLKQTLVARFRAHLDALGAEAEPGAPPDDDPGADLRSLFVELAALRSAVRTEARLVKDALDLFRGVVERTQADRQTTLREAGREREAAVLRPLLIELLEVRDRLAAALAAPPAPVPWYARILRRGTPEADAWREGLRITLDRLDRVLRDRGVVALAVLGKPFDPQVARAVATVADAGRQSGIVTEEIRPGFRWNEALLRAADVVVNKPAREEGP